MSIDRLLATLTAAGLEPTPVEVAETLWLAQHIEPAPVVETRGHVPPAVARGQPPAGSGPAKPGLRPDGRTAAPVHVPAAESTRSQASTAVPIRVPAVKALPETGRIARELRPLNRRSPSRRDIELDEQATADRSAESGKWQLVRRPVQDRWLDLMVIVDVHPSMIIWKALVEELCVLLEQQGAFEDVRIWYLHHQPGGAGLSPVPAATRGLRAPAELVDPTGRRLTLFVSDMVASGWDNGEISKLVERCARYGPTAVLQPLPERLWPRTALRPRHGRIHSLQPGCANRQYRFVARTPEDELPLGTIPVPVLEISASAMGSWARLVTAGSSDGVDATVIGIAEEPFPEAEPIRDARKLLAQFRATASPEAYRLVRHLAAAPLSLPVMRLVQRATSAAPDPSHLAEVYLSGLLERTDAPHPDAVAFEFVPGVRDLLTATLRRSEALLVLDAVSRVIAPRFGSAQDFTAYVPVPGRGANATTVSIDSFAVVASQVLERMGVLKPGAVQVKAPQRQVRDPALENFVTEHANSLYVYFLQRLENSHQAEDAVQEVLTRATVVRNRDPSRELPTRAALYDIARKVAAEFYKASSRGPLPLSDVIETEYDDDEVGPFEHLPPEPPSDYQLLQSKQPLWDAMVDALDGIPPRYRRTLTAHNRLMQARQRSVSSTELAEELGISSKRANRELHRALQATKTAIQALVVARTSTCPSLWDAVTVPPRHPRAGRGFVLDPATSRQVARHFRQCAVCGPIAREAGEYTSW